MAARSLTATPNGIEHINHALTQKKWAQTDLWKLNDCCASPQPAKKFCTGKPVDRKIFVCFCEALGLDWEEIAGLKAPETVTESTEPQTDIDALVQTIRQKVYADIHHRCCTMRVLDMEQPIGIGDIYTNVNILEKLSGRRRLGLNELLQDCDLENFDRFLLGRVRHERVPGLEAVERHRQLMVLGKPGAGKTTFMKRLATLCNHGEFQAGRVPVFVTLKEFAEAKGQPDLQTYIGQQWGACGIEDTEVLGQVLGLGRALILLDGLDEVQETDHDRILQEIKGFTGQYRDCQFVMTCRIAAREYTFQHFTEVEVADFDEGQIAEFATKWFTAKEDLEKGKTLIQRLEDNEPIQELATNPLLLTLLCLVFGEANDFPVNRAELYKEGLDVLLKKWDAKRNIERDQVYKKLSLKRKEDLLSQLAFATFTNGNYFFKQSVVERYIMDYIRNLAGAHEDEEALQLDSEAVLKSIEAQHGLLVERARGIYSFSHLTFQEYFTAKQATQPSSKSKAILENLIERVTEQRYREVFLLSVGMLPEADDLLLAMKREVDLILAEEPSLQAFLSWVLEKSNSIRTHGKISRIRAVYFVLGYEYTADPIVRRLDETSDKDFDKGSYYELMLDESSGLILAFKLAYAIESPSEYVEITLNGDIALDSYLYFISESLYSKNVPDGDFEQFQNHLNHLAQALANSIYEANEADPILMYQLQMLKDRFPTSKNINSWKSEKAESWANDFHEIIYRRRNIGRDWCFSDAEQERAKRYYSANKLLVDCLNSDCYVTKATRQYIEDTLLLPMSEIEKIPVPSR